MLEVLRREFTSPFPGAGLRDRLREKIFEVFGGWEYLSETARRPQKPEAIYSDFPTLKLPITTPQFKVDNEWYCFDLAVSSSEDMWNISLENLEKYVNACARFEIEQEQCEVCNREDNDCAVHSRGYPSYEKGKDTMDLMTDVQWRNCLIHEMFYESRRSKA